MRALIHVAGDTVFRGSLAPYRIGDRTICSSSTIIPIVMSLGSKTDDLRVLVVLPQSLITYAERDSEVRTLPDSNDKAALEEWIKGATSRLGDLFKKMLLAGTHKIKDPEGISDSIEEVINNKTTFSVVQVRGTFAFLGQTRPDPCKSPKFVVRRKISFDGDLGHVLTEVFRFLASNESKFDEVYVDLSQGWNHLTLAAYLGAASYSSVSGASINLKVSEPYVQGVLKECRKGELLEQHYPQVSREPRQEGTELVIQSPEEIVMLNELISDISLITASSRQSISLERVVKLNEYLKREFDRYGCHLRDGRLKLLRAIAELRRASCAYSSVIIPYLHMAILNLRSIESELKQLVSELDSKMKDLDYVLNFNLSVNEHDEINGPLSVSYSLYPPISYPLAKAVLKAIEELAYIAPHGSEVGKMPLSMVDNLLRSYRNAGLNPNVALVINEFDLLDEDGNSRRVIDAFRDPRGGIIRKLKEYTDKIDGCEKQIDPGEIEKRDIYPFYLISELNLKVCDAYDRELDWESLRCSLVKKLEQINNTFAMNLRTAIELKKGGDLDPSRLIRNLMSHAGIQHFSIRNLMKVHGPEDVILFYDVDLFGAIEGKVSSDDPRVSSLESELGVIIRTICDYRKQ